MKLMTYRKDGRQGTAARRGDDWADLGGIDLMAALDAPDLVQRVASAPVLDLNSVKVLPPIPRPGKIICIGLNYADHAAESPYDAPDYPALFPRFTTSLIADGDPIIRPRVSHELDFEGELVAIIGTTGRNIPKAKATSHVAAYSIFNDGSVRDYQFKAPQWTVGKNFDDTGAFGPWAVTADELPDGAKGLKLQTRLNGEVVQNASTDDLLFPVADLITIISEAITLEAGDIIVTGTPAGIGWARKPKLFMKPGDVVEVEIEGIGTLRNPVMDEAA